jgi:hypothetical protein
VPAQRLVVLYVEGYITCDTVLCDSTRAHQAQLCDKVGALVMSSNLAPSGLHRLTTASRIPAMIHMTGWASDVQTCIFGWPYGGGNARKGLNTVISVVPLPGLEPGRTV